MSARSGRGRFGRTFHSLRTAWPYMMMAWERWQSLSDEDKERYKRQAREYKERGREAVRARRRR